MFELTIALLRLIRPELTGVTIALVGLGVLYKSFGTKKMKASSDLIPIVLIVVSFIVCSLIAWFRFTGEGSRIFETFIMGGVVDGLSVTAAAVLLWSTLHGAKKYMNKKNNGGTQ